MPFDTFDQSRGIAQTAAAVAAMRPDWVPLRLKATAETPSIANFH